MIGGEPVDLASVRGVGLPDANADEFFEGVEGDLLVSAVGPLAVVEEVVEGIGSDTAVSLTQTASRGTSNLQSLTTGIDG